MTLGVRVIPVLLLMNDGLVKTIGFRDITYVGDPINAVRIFNDKGVDELLFIDIQATKERRKPNFDLVSRISREAFMPFGYGGGVRNLEEMSKLFKLGVEKISLNSYAIENPDFVESAAHRFGSQSVVASIDVKRDKLDKHWIFDYRTSSLTQLDPMEFAVLMERKGAGEILLNSVDKDRTFDGYDIDIVRKVSLSVKVPVIALGGAGSLEDFRKAVKDGGASAVAAGSFFIFHGKHRAVLITYPDKEDLRKAISGSD